MCLNSLVRGREAAGREAAGREAALRALAHPGRRRVLELLAGAERTSGSLAAACGWTKPAASQQLKVLRRVGLVDVRADGNRRLYRVRAEGLAQLRAFLDDFWAERLAGLEDEIRGSR
jgi:DNA-binding transcriptional ArsR family regulator